MKNPIPYPRWLEHDGAPARVVSMTCALLATGGMLAFFLGILAGGVSTKHASAHHHGGSFMVVRLFDDAEGRTETLPVPPEPMALRKAQRAFAQPRTLATSDSPRADATQEAGVGEVRCPVARSAPPHMPATFDSSHIHAIAMDQRNTAAQDAAFDELRCQFGMRAIAHLRHPGERAT